MRARLGSAFALAGYFARQDLSGRFRGNLAGAAWVVVAPLLQLLVFYFVFLHIFRSRVPGLEGNGYLAFLALGFWPWFAFSEAIARATTALQDNAALAAKVAMPKASLVLGRVLAAFALHGAGYAVVLMLLPLLGIDLAWRWLPVALLLWLPLFVLATGLGMAGAVVQVFVRDLGQMIGHLLQLAFFLTPILYSAHMVPERFRPVLQWNPLAVLVGGGRDLMLGVTLSTTAVVVALTLTIMVSLAGWLLFRRCERHVEDFL